MSSNRKNGTNTDERNPDGTFAAGNPGRPKGARHKVTRAVEALLEGQAEELTQSAIDAVAAQSVLQAVAEGNVTPLEGATLMGLIDSYRRTLELTEIEQRISALETANE